MTVIKAYDGHAMRMAIREAELALERGDRPFGCVILNPHGAIIAYAGGSETPTDPTRHCEIDAIKMACERAQGLLYGCLLASTHEPCPMCCGAITHAKIQRVVWGSYRADLPELFSPKLNRIRSRLSDTRHPPSIRGGVFREECIDLFAAEVQDARASAA